MSEAGGAPALEATMSGPSAHASLAVLLVFALLLVGQWNHDLWTPDEPREAEIGRAMAASGDYLVPTLAGEPFLEKPPGYYALLASWIRIGGTTDAGWLRMPSAVFVLLTALLTFAIGRRFLGFQVGVLAALVFLTFELTFYDLSHRVVIDPMLLFACTLALFGFLRALDGRVTRTALPFWAGLCLAFAAKGLVGPALVLIACAAMCLAVRRVAFVRVLRPVTGALAFAGLVALWCWLLYRRGGAAFVSEFVVHNQLMRFLGGEAYGGGHEAPFYAYLLMLPVALLPWTPIAIAVIVTMLGRRHRTAPERVRPGTDLFLAWSLAMVLLLSAASTKRDIYLAPALPALAILIAYGLDQAALLAPRLRALLARVHVGIAVLAIALVPIATVVALQGSWWVAVIGLVVAAWLVARARSRLDSPGEPAFLCAAAALAFLAIAVVAFPRLDPMSSLRPIAQRVAALAPDGQRLYGYKLDETMRAVMPFYAGLTPPNLWDGGAADDEGVARLDRLLGEREPCRILVLERHLEQAWPKLRHPYEILLRIEKSARRVVLVIGNIGARD